MGLPKAASIRRAVSFRIPRGFPVLESLAPTLRLVN
ncbi:hypothetical protein EDF71_121101 [Comamonas sp. JUb58]|nr:hypothetical protein EDF71_121101 [Comamonas sp. JUb58]